MPVHIVIHSACPLLDPGRVAAAVVLEYVKPADAAPDERTEVVVGVAVEGPMALSRAIEPHLGRLSHLISRQTALAEAAPFGTWASPEAYALALFRARPREVRRLQIVRLATAYDRDNDPR